MSYLLAEQLVPRFASLGVLEKIALADSGAVGLLSYLADEFDNKERSKILWSSASNDGNTVDWVGYYRFFVADHEKRIVHFQHLWGLCVETMTLELFGICQLNTFDIGYDSPPINKGSPYLYRSDPGNKVHECSILQNGLPHINNIHTQQALGLLHDGYKLCALDSGEEIQLSSAIPALASLINDTVISSSLSSSLALHRFRPVVQALGRAKEILAINNASYSPTTLGTGETSTDTNTGHGPLTLEDTMRALTEEQRADLFKHSIETGQFEQAMRIIKGKQREVHLWCNRLGFVSPDVMDGMLRQTVNHGLRDGDGNKHLLPILSRWRASLRLTRRRGVARAPTREPLPDFSAWSADLHEWPVRSYPHNYKYFVVFHERRHHLRFVFLLRKKSDLQSALIALNAFIEGRCSLHSSEKARFRFLYSDLEGALYNEKGCRKWLRDNGVHIEACPPHHHEMNSAAEQDGFLIEQIVNSMLNFARAPEALWPFAVVQMI